MKELTAVDLRIAFEQDIRMALYTLDRYNIEANLALVACDEYDIDKAHLMQSVRQSDIIKKCKNPKNTRKFPKKYAKSVGKVKQFPQKIREKCLTF